MVQFQAYGRSRIAPMLPRPLPDDERKLRIPKFVAARELKELLERSRLLLTQERHHGQGIGDDRSFPARPASPRKLQFEEAHGTHVN